jgi:C4-type Zn-finger protein
MSEIETFFRHCPACGRRFEIRLVSKKAEDTREETFMKRIDVPVNMGPSSYGGAFSPLAVQEEIPTTIEVTDFNYTYRCKHCGHMWSEIHVEEAEEAESEMEGLSSPSSGQDQTTSKNP